MKKMFLAAIGACTIAAPAAAAPVLWSDNGHYYEFVQGSADWATARAAALASTHLGQQGYLVTITSAEENAFIAALTNALAWTGGNDIATEGTWVWADGPEANAVFWTGGPAGSGPGYSNWLGGEPNEFTPGEDALHLNFGGNNGGWNDYFTSSTHGYIVEYSGVVPEPATWALFILGFGAVGGALRRSRKVRASLTYA